VYYPNSPNNEPTLPSFPQAPKQQRRRPKIWQIVALLVLLAFVVWSAITLYTIIPASAATITITPVKKSLTHVYTLTVASGTSSDIFTAPGRQIAATSQERTKTITATGHGTHPATQAAGNVIISQIHLDDTRPNQYLEPSTITDINGVKVTTDKSVPISEGATVTIPAHAEAGSAGNIAAHNLDGQIEIVDHTTQAHVGAGYASNPDPFTGGNDPVDFTFVQQSDIDGSANQFASDVTPDTKTQVQKQLHADEHFVQDPQCKPNIDSNHKANDEAGDVSIKVTVTCSALAYTDQALRDTAVNAYKHDGNDQFGSEYGVAGDVVTSKPTRGDNNTFTLKADGVWSYQYTSQRQQQLKNQIAGKKQQDALTFLHNRKEIKDVSLTTTGLPGNAVPSALENIKLVVNQVVGLHQ